MKFVVLTLVTLLFYLNLLVLKNVPVNFILAFVFILFPVAVVPNLLKWKGATRSKVDIASFVFWGVALIPTVLFIGMTVMFGMPPEGFELQSLWHERVGDIGNKTF